MSDKRFSPEIGPLRKFKERVIRALFSDDELMDSLVLKGGTAMELFYEDGGRASIDIDLSLDRDIFLDDPKWIKKIEDRLVEEFADIDMHVFDLKITRVPDPISEDRVSFWGGYRVEFKVVSQEIKDSTDDINTLRRNSAQIGQKGKFTIDVSKFEYCDPKVTFNIDGITVFAYSREMIVAEKLRALAQQTESYCARLSKPRTPRARDFFDIYTLVKSGSIDMSNFENVMLIRRVCEAKRVLRQNIREIELDLDFHKSSFPTVKDTLSPGTSVDEFEFYFDFVLSIISSTESAWIE